MMSKKLRRYGEHLLGCRPKLSICIPTFNRASYLINSLRAFEKAIGREYSSKVEICISDNTSTDNTQVIVEEFSRQAKFRVRYRVNKANLGAGRNFLAAVDLAQGDYCWLFGSDDEPLPGSIRTIIDALDHENVQILLGDRLNITRQGSLLDSDCWYNEPIIVNIDNLYTYITGLKSIGGLFSYISDIVFNRNLWLTQLLRDGSTVKLFKKSPYVHVLILLLIWMKIVLFLQT